MKTMNSIRRSAIRVGRWVLPAAAHVVRAGCIAVARRFHERAKETVRVSGKQITISLGNDGLFVVPRTRALVIRRDAAALSFEPGEGKAINVLFPSEARAAAALRRIRRRTLSNRTLVWTGRIVLLAFAWLMVSSYLKVRVAQQEAVAAAVAKASALTALPDAKAEEVSSPSAPEPLQSGPVALAGTAPITSIGGTEFGGRDTMPAASTSSTSDPASALGGFGLDIGADAGVGATPGEPVAAVSAQGPGCNPDLAFKAPAR